MSSSIETAKLCLIKEVKEAITFEIQLDAAISKLEKDIAELTEQTERTTTSFIGTQKKNDSLVILLSKVEKLLSTL